MKLIKTLSVIFLIFFAGCSFFKMDRPGLMELTYPESLPIIQRADWGWSPIDTSFTIHQIKYITVHHGGVEFAKDKDPYKHVKNLQSWSRKEKKWLDIPYHYMISPDGKIFEARPLNIPGDTNTEYDPTNHALVEIMGNFEIQQLTDEQYASMTGLIKFLSVRFDIPMDRIKTHKDYSDMTVCPGENIYKLFIDGSIKKALKLD